MFPLSPNIYEQFYKNKCKRVAYVRLVPDEYESGDTSDEEDRRNTVGDVPLWWYRDYPHVGYDTDARRLLKPPQRDRIDDFLQQCEDADFWRTVRDPHTGQDVVLSAQDLRLIQRLRAGLVPDAAHDDYQVSAGAAGVFHTKLNSFVNLIFIAKTILIIILIEVRVKTI